MSPRKRRELIQEVGLELWRVSNTNILEATSAADRLVTHYDREQLFVDADNVAEAASRVRSRRTI